ncbi:hypothetical protein jhhlp_005131 [Lomentospora prolificans]|uniref:Uncharacterized protein n=1 Tax=Lomentospora prolificans TaxID=41688 RepID=A0A2N3N7K6_9PEZI|nr:hypothetical protein jhhlp_005131 [Lomentospora prolificans]
MDEEGKKALKRINGNVSGYDLENECAIIKNTICEEREINRELGQDNLTCKELVNSYLECFNRENIRRARHRAQGLHSNL